MRKTDIPGYSKRNDGVVINRNTAELNQYLEARERLKSQKQQQEKLEELEERFENLDNKLDLILEKLSGK